MISVVVPLFNKEKFISETLKSVLFQSFPNFELLVVNDGSSDASLSEVEAFSDSRIKIINIENSGVSVARNTGIKHAKYQWIAILDADDYWAPTFLEEMAKAIKLHPDQGLFASGRSRVFHSEIEPYLHAMLPPEGEITILSYFKVISEYLPLISSSSVVIRKSLFETAGKFRKGQRKHEDHDMWLRLAVHQPVVFVHKNVSFYRKTDKNTASVAAFRAEDFCTYISTMIIVKEQLTRDDLLFFRKYYDRFTVLVYLQYYGSYSKEERKQIVVLLEKLLEGRALRNLKFIDKLPLQQLYPLYKKMKGK